MKVADAVSVLATTYLSLDVVARGLEVTAAEVTAALAKAKPDTVEFVCLTVLAQYNSVIQIALPEPAASPPLPQE